MRSISVVFHGQDKIDFFDSEEEARDFAHELAGQFTLATSDQVTDHTAFAEEVESEEWEKREYALKLALSTGVQGEAVIRTAEDIRKYLESGTLPWKPSGTTKILSGS